MVSPHSPGANCEEDFTEGSLTSYKNLFDKAQTLQYSTTPTVAADLPPTIHQMSSTIAFIRVQTQTYIAGYIMKKLNKIIFKNCKYCLNELCTKNAREYQFNRKSLKYPSLSFQSIVQQIISYVGKKMSIVCHHENVLEGLCYDVSNIYNFNNVLTCPEHKDIFPSKIISVVVK